MKLKTNIEVISQINNDLGAFCEEFQKTRINFNNNKQVARKNKVFNNVGAKNGYAFNIGGQKEIQYHIGFYENIRYGLGFNTAGRPSKNNTMVELVKPFMESFLQIENEIRKLLPKCDFINSSKKDLIEPKENNFVLFGKEIKINQDEEGKSIDDEQYNLMLSDFKKNMFEAYKLIFEKRNEFINKKQEMKDYIELLKSNKNIVLTGAPGTGKTYLAKEIAKQMTGTKADETNEKYAFVQFHPSYDYTDFVEGLRPIKNENDKKLGFELKNGIFKEFCKKAKDDPNPVDNKYVFVIDEINRAEISKVFGELFFAIDPGYRGEKGKVKTQYANMQTKETRFNDNDDYFYVPDNVYIIGTMNDIDRSVESFDFAMRRRFAWKEITPDDRKSMLDEELKEHPTWIEIAKTKMKNLNTAIYNEVEKDGKIERSGIEGLSSSYHIGPAYFLKLKNYTNDPWDKLWENHLEVLLREYLRGMPDAETNLSDLNKAYNKEK